MRPAEITKRHEKRLLKTVYNVARKQTTPKFQLGDRVRISRAKVLFRKSYLHNWTTEIFEVSRVLNTVPTTYRLKDTNENDIQGIFYEVEMLKVKQPDIYLVEKILKRKGDKVLVRWLGLPEAFDSYIDTKDLYSPEK